MTDIQRRLDVCEAPRMEHIATGPRRDALDHLGYEEIQSNYKAWDHSNDEVGNDYSTRLDHAEHAKLAARTLRLCLDMMRLVTMHKRPSLYAACCIIALGDEYSSMRKVSKVERVSPEWVSKLTDDIRKRFSLPKNQHNKSDTAANKYRELRLGKTRKAS